jgi:hypothetical protein
MKTTLVLAILLAGTTLSFVPAASADSCASTILEDQVCGAVYVFYCAFALPPAKQLAQCEVGAVQRALTIPPQGWVLP